MSKMKRGWRMKKIYEIVKEKKRVSVREIMDSTDINYNTIKSSLITLTNQGLIERIGKGKYQHKSK